MPVKSRGGQKKHANEFDRKKAIQDQKNSYKKRKRDETMKAKTNHAEMEKTNHAEMENTNPTKTEMEMSASEATEMTQAVVASTAWIRGRRDRRHTCGHSQKD